MKSITKILVVIFMFFCTCYYFDIDIFKEFASISNINNIGKAKEENKQASMSTVTIPDNNTLNAVKPEEHVQTTEVKESDTYTEVIKFLINQKNDKKLIESYRVTDKKSGANLMDRSYIADDSFASIALYNDVNEDSKKTAVDILKNLASIQNKDGSWYDFYNTSGNPVSISGKQYNKCSAGDNALVLYAFSYYKIISGDTQFKDVMKKSADYILSKCDTKDNGVYDYEISSKGARTLKSNTFAYFGLREYAMSHMFTDYQEYKDKLFAADKIASWIVSSCIDKGVFIKGYTGKTKDMSSNIDCAVLGSLFINSTRLGDKIKYSYKELEPTLSKLYKELGDIEGYKIDNDSKNKSFIWFEGSGKVSLVLNKLDEKDKSSSVLEYIRKYQDVVPKSLEPRGIPYSTNVDQKIDMVSFEAVSASAWAAIAFQCNSHASINNILFGREEEVFKSLTQE